MFFQSGGVMRSLTATGVMLFAFVFSASAVNGIAVSVNSSSTNSFGHHMGNIMKYVITNSKPDAGVLIYSGGNARCVSISPNGSKIAFIRGDGKVCMQSIQGGQVTVLASIPKDAWLDWPDESWIVYTNKWKGDELWKVNTSGTPNPQKLATGLGSAMQTGISKDMKRGTTVTCCYSARSFSIADGKVTFASSNAGCGTGIAPSGNYFSNNLSGHNTVAIRNFSGSQVHKWSANKSCGGANWNRNRWSANSDDWVTFTQGIEYQLGGGHHQVLYKKDGSECIAVQTLVANKFYEGDDFWVGTATTVNPRNSSYSRDSKINGSAEQISVYNLLGARQNAANQILQNRVVVLRGAGPGNTAVLQFRSR